MGIIRACSPLAARAAGDKPNVKMHAKNKICSMALDQQDSLHARVCNDCQSSCSLLQFHEKTCGRHSSSDMLFLRRFLEFGGFMC